MKRSVVACVVVAALVGVPAPCRENSEPDRIVVQHILISFKAKTGRFVDRNKKEAETLAKEVLELARAGEDFDQLVRKYTDDSAPGIHRMTNFKVEAMAAETPRDGMVKYFGDVAFSLEVGEVGLAEFHATRSPYGWHVIKRLE
jgi:hypothetical protein